MEKKTSGGTSNVNNFKQRLNVTEGITIRPWKDYVPPKELRANEARARAYMSLPSLVK